MAGRMSAFLDDRLVMRGAMQTDMGRVRTSNEDAIFYVAPEDEEAGARGALAVVADGMGGHAAGEIASAIAAEALRRVYFASDRPVPEALNEAIMTANQAIFEHAAADPACAGMGTTCTAVAFRGSKLWLVHVGDSRAYLLRNGALNQLSEDQSLHAQLVRDGLMTEAEAKSRPGANYLLQALGTRPDVMPIIWNEGLPVRAGDIVLLCSDGLTNLVAETTIVELAARHEPQEACRLLIDAACKAGGYDNVSVGIFRITQGRPAVPSQNATRRLAAFGSTDESESAGETTTREVAASARRP